MNARPTGRLKYPLPEVVLPRFPRKEPTARSAQSLRINRYRYNYYPATKQNTALTEKGGEKNIYGQLSAAWVINPSPLRLHIINTPGFSQVESNCRYRGPTGLVESSEASETQLPDRRGLVASILRPKIKRLMMFLDHTRPALPLPTLFHRLLKFFRTFTVFICVFFSLNLIIKTIVGALLP